MHTTTLGSPWHALDGRSPADAIGRIFAPLAADVPRFIAALQQTCTRLEAEQDREGRWRLVYHLRRTIPPEEHAWESPQRILMGGAPGAAQPAPGGIQVPPGLARFYAIHDGFGVHMSDFGVGCLLPARQLERPFTDRPDWVSYHIDDGGHRQLLIVNPLTPDAPPRSLDWDRETGELAAPRSVLEFIDINLTQDILGVERLPGAPQPAGVYPTDALLSRWGHLPAAPMAGAVISGTIYVAEIRLRYPDPPTIPTLASRWRHAFLAADWKITAMAARGGQVAMAVQKGWRNLSLLVSLEAPGVMVTVNRENTVSQPLPQAWGVRDLPIGDGIVRVVHDEPCPHLALGYPGAELVDEQARWLAALSGWRVADRGGFLQLTRGSEQLMVALRQELLSVEVLVFEAPAAPLPPLFAALEPIRTGPLKGDGVYGDYREIALVWGCSPHPHHYTHRPAVAALERYASALQASGWVRRQDVQDELGPGLWMSHVTPQKTHWVSVVISHIGEYCSNIYLSLWSSVTAPTHWHGVSLPVDIGWVVSMTDTTLQWKQLWPLGAPGPSGRRPVLREGIDLLEKAWSARVPEGVSIEIEDHEECAWIVLKTSPVFVGQGEGGFSTD
ncbi:MAG: hypothetical protein AAFV53_21435 [Myxococcota bacterium]